MLVSVATDRFLSEIKLAKQLEEAGVPVLGTPYDSIDRTEDRKRFSELVTRLGLNQPANGIASSLDEARELGRKLGYPIMVRPSSASWRMTRSTLPPRILSKSCSL